MLSLSIIVLLSALFLSSISLGALQSSAGPGYRRWDNGKPPYEVGMYDQELLDYSMTLGDFGWDEASGWIVYNSKGRLNVRFTAWYTVGLLHRSGPGDVERAHRAIRNVISAQYVNDTFSEPWHGTYKVAADLPDPGPTWRPLIYDSYDPNWSFFIGVTLMQVVEEFESKLNPALIDDIVKSCYRASRGLMARVGYNGDNLVTAYTNPALGRAVLVRWTGDRLGDHNLTRAGEQYAQDIYDLFTAEGYNNFAEYNALTYYGEDIALLAQWIRHAPRGSSLPDKARFMLAKMWEDIADLYNYDLKNIVGPYDRASHRNMLVDNSITSLWFWQLLGRAKAPVAPQGQVSTQYDSYQGASFALLGSTVRSVVNQTLIDKLVTPRTGDYTTRRFIRDSLDNDTTRTDTMWISPNLMIGGQELAEEVIRGGQFVPLIAHWKAAESADPQRPQVAYFQLYPSATTINATVTQGHVRITYPNTTQPGTDRMEFRIAGIPADYYEQGKIMNGFDNLPCLSVKVDHPGMNVTIGKFADASLGSDSTYPVIYFVQPDFRGIPTLDMTIEYTC